MQITDVRVRKVAKEGKLKAVVSITMDEEFVVHDIKVIEGEKGLFIAMPSKRALDGEYRDIAHPINSGTRDRIQKIILDIIPCHLETEFYFRYLTWAECEAAGYTWGQVEAAEYTWESFQLAVPPER